jgi:hypothetical protein
MQNPMPAESIFEAKIDAARNLVRTRYSGDITAAAMQEVVSRVETFLPDLKPGFSLFADFRDVASIGLDCVPSIAKIMDLCREHGIGLIVRRLPEPARDIGINILAVVHYRGQVRTVTVDTVEEAERALR